MSEELVIRRLLLPELQFVKSWVEARPYTVHMEVSKVSEMEVCPRCAVPSRAGYDRRWVRVRDAPLRDGIVMLHIRKRRFWCKPCGKPFTEPVPGVKQGSRSTERYGRHLLRACERYTDLKQVRRDFRCSGSFLYRTLYRHLELRRRQKQYPFSKVIGIDEHFFKKDRKHGGRDFVTMVVDHKKRRLTEVVHGKTHAALHQGLAHIPGAKNVEYVTLDLSDSYKSFAKEFFPNAKLIADKFHVLRLLSPALIKRKRELMPQDRSPMLRRLLLSNYSNLRPSERWALQQVLEAHPVLAEIHSAKEALHRLYRTRVPAIAKDMLTRLCDQLANTTLPELATLRRTLMKWRTEVIQYFYTRLTNARVEGFNLKAKLVKRRAFGYRSFENYRLRLLNACA